MTKQFEYYIDGGGKEVMVAVAISEEEALDMFKAKYPHTKRVYIDNLGGVTKLLGGFYLQSQQLRKDLMLRKSQHIGKFIDI